MRLKRYTEITLLISDSSRFVSSGGHLLIRYLSISDLACTLIDGQLNAKGADMMCLILFMADLIGI